MQNKSIAYLFSNLLITAILLMFFSCASVKHTKELSNILKTDLEILKEETPVLDGKLIYNPDIITQLYDKGGNLIPVKWGSKEKIKQMLFAIRNVSQDGLNPNDYHLSAIEKLADTVIRSDKAEIEDVAQLELLLTDAFLLLSSHLVMGKTDPETIDPQWKASRRTVRLDWESFIDSTLKSKNIIENLQNLTPKHREYNNLKIALSKYRQIEQNDGWESFSTFLPKLEKGMRHPDIALLRKRIAISQGYIEFDSIDENLFDQHLHDQVVLFQKRNGLTPDGLIGKSTIAAMNIPVKDRIATIEANLERWRWLNDDLGKRYIKVNIADFNLQVIENDKQVFYSMAVVGRLYRETPVFSSMIKYMVLNPYWTVPPTILYEDVIPSVRKDPAYLIKKNMKILRNDGTEVDPLSIDWSSALTTSFPYHIRQDPGPSNSLGQIKFMFPNQYSVYIHDSPSRSLYLQTDRSFSSGCIRIEKSRELAEYLLKDKPEWGPEQIKNAIALGKERTIILANPVQVHILYLTAWADDDGKVYFRKDVYSRDHQLIAALNQPPPGLVH